MAHCKKYEMLYEKERGLKVQMYLQNKALKESSEDGNLAEQNRKLKNRIVGLKKSLNTSHLKASHNLKLLYLVRLEYNNSKVDLNQLFSMADLELDLGETAPVQEDNVELAGIDL